MHDWDNDGFTIHFATEIAANRNAKSFFDFAQVAACVVWQTLDSFPCLACSFVEDFGAFVRTDNAALEQIRWRVHLAAIAIDDCNGNDDTGGGEHATVAELEVGSVADVFAVDEEASVGDFANDFCATLGEFEDVAVVDDERVFDAALLTEFGVFFAHTEFTVHGNQVGWLGHVNHHLELFLLRMTGAVNFAVVSGDDGGTAFGQVIEHEVDGVFVARDLTRAQHDGVIGMNFDVVMIAVGHASERGARLGLATGGDDDDFVGGVVFHILHVDDDVVVRQCDESELAGDSEVFRHAVAAECYFSAMFAGQFNNGGHAMQVAGELRDDQAAFCGLKQFAETVFDAEFTAGESG